MYVCRVVFFVGFARCTSSTIVFHWTLEVEFWFSGFGFGFRCALLWILIDLIVYLADMVCLFVGMVSCLEQNVR